MSKSSGIVLATPEGQYINMHKVSTMVGWRTEFALTDNLEQATVFSSVGHLRMTQRETRCVFPAFNMLPVEVTRTVQLTGWGVKE